MSKAVVTTAQVKQIINHFEMLCQGLHEDAHITIMVHGIETKAFPKWEKLSSFRLVHIENGKHRLTFFEGNS